MGESFRRTINSTPLDDCTTRIFINGSNSLGGSISPSGDDFNHWSEGIIYHFVGTKSAASHGHPLSEISMDEFPPRVAS